ncbi:hypothetical protein Q9L58_000117 [Maublancomyces gigas]|uniref:Uncharacterized protein n=1 Tax=Discina gigas TaxID=1032678 RepID=A0ABR3GYD5_9PEZI
MSNSSSQVGSVVLMFNRTSPFVWLQFTPITFITKLNIELSMSDLLMKLATQKCSIEAERDQRELADRELTGSGTTAKSAVDDPTQSTAIEMSRLDPDDSWQWAVLRTQEIVMDVERAEAGGSASASTTASGFDNDEQPLRREWERVGYHGSATYKTEVKTVPIQNSTGEQ